MIYQPNKRQMPESPADLAKRLSLPFTNLHLLIRALTHRSYINEHSDALEDNERLEFLGDAVLDFVVGAWLYNHFPEMTEGELTRLRSALVRTEQLAEYARNLDLGRSLRLGRGEVDGGGYDRPALLCATFEAVIGALYLDAGVSAVERFVIPLLEDAREHIYLGLNLYDPKSRLQEWAQGQKLGSPKYLILKESGPEHSKSFEVEVQVDGRAYGQGSGYSKQVAAQKAAQTALEYLGLI